MCSKFSDRLFIKRNAEKLIFLFAVLTASLVTELPAGMWRLRSG